MAACFAHETTPSTTNQPGSSTMSTSPLMNNATAISPAVSSPVTSNLITNIPTVSTPPTRSPILRTPVISYPIISDLPVNKYSGKGVTDHNYFYPEEEFSFQMKSSNNMNNLIILQAKYITKRYIKQYTPSSDQVSCDFEVIDSHTPISILFPYEKIYEINLDPGVTYRIISQINAGFPSAYGLIIFQDYEIIFTGITDWAVDGYIGIDNVFWPNAFPSINMKQGSLLQDNYLEYDNESMFIRSTNLEIQFSLGDKTFTLHQGQSANLGDYKIDLMLAVIRYTRYKREVVDGGSNGFSFMLSKLVESEP